MGRDFLPRQDVALVDGASRATTPFYVFLQSLERAVEQGVITPEQFAELAARVTALENADPTAFVILGVGSVLVQGSVADGMVQLTLAGDENEPGRTFLYGTGPDGAKGWHRLYDAVEGGEGIAITDSGYTVLGEVDTPGDLPAIGNAGEAWRVLDPAGLYAWDGAAFTLDEAATGVVGIHVKDIFVHRTGNVNEDVDGVKTFTGNGPIFAGKATQLRSDNPSFQLRTPASTRRYRLRYEATEAKDGPFLIQKREAGAWYERLSISDDTLQVRHNNQLVTDTTIPPGGIYTPALTNGANVTASDTWVWSYIRIGYAVSMSGQLVVTPTVDAALTTLRVSLPIESTLNDARDIGGSGSFTVSGVAGPVFVAADPASDDLLVSFYASGTDPHVVGVSIVYPVQPILVIEPYTDETGAVYVDDDENVYYYVGTA